MAALDDFLATLQQYMGGPYRSWAAGGTGLDAPSIEQVRGNGESCAGMMNAALMQIGLSPVGGVLEWIAAIQDMGPPDLNADLPLGTFVIEEPNATDPEGHVAVVVGPNNLLAQSDDYTMSMQANRTLSEMANVGGIYFNHSGSLPALGGASTGGGDGSGSGDGSTGSPISSQLPSTPATTQGASTGATSPPEPAAATGISGVIGELAKAIAEGVGFGMLKWVRYIYAYTILRPLDFASGFYYELPKQELAYTMDNGNSFWDRWWNLVFLGATVYLAFGRAPDGVNWSEKMLNSGAELGKVDTNRTQQPRSVALTAQKVGTVRVGVHRQQQVKLIRHDRDEGQAGSGRRSTAGRQGAVAKERVERVRPT